VLNARRIVELADAIATKERALAGEQAPARQRGAAR